MTHKTKKLSVAIIAFVAAICMFVAILGFVGMPNNVSASDGDGAETSYYLISKRDCSSDLNKWTTKEAPDGNIVTIKFETIARDSVGRHAHMLAMSESGSATNSSHSGAIVFGDSWSPVGSTVTYIYNLTEKKGQLIGSDGQTEVMSLTWTDDCIYFGGQWYKPSTMVGITGLFKITATDETGKDLGVKVLTDGLEVTTDEVYVVTTNDNNGNVVGYPVKSGETFAVPTAPTRDGYLFGGWYTDAELTVAYDFSSTVTANKTLYAKYYDQTPLYTAKVNNAGGANTTVLSRLAPSANATKVYFEYTLSDEQIKGVCGWLGARMYYSISNASGSNKELAGIQFGAYNNPCLAANTTYIITFDLVNNTMTWVDKAVPSVVLKEGTLAEGAMTDFAYFGFYANIKQSTLFTGDSVVSVRAYDDLGKDLQITTTYPQSTSIDYPEVTFNADNGSAATKTTVSGATVAEPTAPTKDGYRFLGWYKDGQALAYDFATEVTGDMTLTAKWAKIERVYSHAGDSAKSFYTKETPATGATKVYLAYVPKTLYGTGGGGNVGLSATNGTETTTNWKPAEGGGFSHHLNSHFFVPGYSYVITVDLNTGAAENRDHQLRMTATFDTEKFNHFGIWTNGCTEIAFSWEVVAWDNTGKDLGVMFVDGTWNKHDYTATFNTDCDTVINPVGIEAGTKLAQPSALTKDGKYFAGWYTDSAFNNAYDFDSVVNADVTLYAKWVDFDAYYANVLTMGGASARLDESVAKSGIRFTVNVNTALLSELASEGYNYKLGTLIVPLDYVTDGAPTMESLDASGLGYYDIVSTYESGESYYGTLANVKQENYGRKWVALGYVAIDMGDDTVKYIYAEYDESNAKSIYDVAESFYNEYKDDVDEVENVEIASVYVDSVVVLDSGYQAVEKVTGNALPYTVSAAGNVITITVNDGADFVIKSVVIDGKIAKVNVAADGKSATYEVVQQ